MNNDLWRIVFKVSHPADDNISPEEATKLHAETQEEAKKKFVLEFLDEYSRPYVEIIMIEKAI